MNMHVWLLIRTKPCVFKKVYFLVYLFWKRTYLWKPWETTLKVSIYTWILTSSSFVKYLSLKTHAVDALIFKGRQHYFPRTHHAIHRTFTRHHYVETVLSSVVRWRNQGCPRNVVTSMGELRTSTVPLPIRLENTKGFHGFLFCLF